MNRSPSYAIIRKRPTGAVEHTLFSRRGLRFVKKRSLTLFQWIWQSYLHTAITPLILAVALFVSVYVVSNVWIRQQSSHMHREASQHEILAFTEGEAFTISDRLNNVSNLVTLYARQAGSALGSPAELDAADSNRLGYGDGGVYHTLRDRSDGGVAVYYSGFVPVEDPQREKVARLLTTQSLLRDIYTTNSLVAAVYFNAFDSLNIIYPYHDFSVMNPPGVDITQYNFYYLADKRTQSR